jgi:holo-ACP synthase/triphosphoribosyl-dephospho-CoA synthase
LAGRIGFSQRKWYICGEDAFICSSRKRHPCEQVIQHMLTTMDDHFNHKFAEYTSSLAMKALSYEVAVSPKPGLVDRFHNGAHDDMDYFMFLDSIAALIPYFYQTTLYAAQFPGTLEEMLTRSRFMGKEAESDMFAATRRQHTQGDRILLRASLRLRGVFVSEK